jgi:hypothetical protein
MTAEIDLSRPEVVNFSFQNLQRFAAVHHSSQRIFTL